MYYQQCIRAGMLIWLHLEMCVCACACVWHSQLPNTHTLTLNPGALYVPSVYPSMYHQCPLVCTSSVPWNVPAAYPGMYQQNALLCTSRMYVPSVYSLVCTISVLPGMYQQHVCTSSVLWSWSFNILCYSVLLESHGTPVENELKAVYVTSD